MREQVGRIIQKLEQVRREQVSCFGADSHKFLLGSSLPEREVQAFESRHDVRLPEEYREFLLHVGHKGAGPYYGLLALEDWNDGYPIDPDELSEDALGQPSPVTAQLTQEEWEDLWESEPVRAVQGSLTLAHHGCGIYAMLCVSGPSRGRIWYGDLDGSCLYLVPDPDFLHWYERWLDELLAGYDFRDFGYGLLGNEAELLSTFLTTQDDKTRDDALRSLVRMPSLTEDSLQALLECLEDTNEERCRTAIWALGRLRPNEAVEPLLSLIQREESTVLLVAAIDALCKFPPFANVEPVRQRLHSSNRSVSNTALYLLREHQKVQMEDVLALFHSESADLRDRAIFATGWIDSSDVVPFLVRALSDPDSYVVYSALSALAERDAVDTVPAMVALITPETSERVLSSIARALGSLSTHPDAFPGLVKLTHHADGFVRNDAIFALGETGDKRAIAVLQQHLSDEETPETYDEDLCSWKTCSFSIGEQAQRSIAKINGEVLEPSGMTNEEMVAWIQSKHE
ncbi:MAG: hypothetical protein EP343_33925 [Deltaproteobacteria bacterium]|nr:MAG: hypothetical protein EP343_33925 [Deltaproteobacteria bacterium]